MLEYLRNASERPVAKILMGLLIFSFVGWGVADWIFSGGGRASVLLRIDGNDITVNDFNAEKQRAVAKLSRDEQRKLFADTSVTNEFYSGILTTMTTDSMVDARARDLGFVVTDHRVAGEIRTFPEFQENGQFSAAMFDNVIMASGYSEQMFANMLRGQILRGYTLGPVGIPVAAPKFSATATYNARYASRDIAYATVKFSDFDVANPTDDNLREYYAAHPKILPETRDASYILISADLTKPDEFDAAYVRAQRAEDAIIGGESLKNVANTVGAKFGTITKMTRANPSTDSVINDALFAKIFSMDAGIESEIIETKDGFVIIYVDKVVAEHPAEFESIKSSLVSDWRKSEQKKQAYVRANEIMVDNEKLSNNATITRASGAPTAVLTAAFRQEIGTSAIVESPTAYYVLNVADATLPKSDDTKMKSISTETANIISRGLMDDYNSFLGREYPAKVYPREFEKLFGNN